MYNVKMIDIGGNKDMTEFNTSVDTLLEAELLAGAEIAKNIDVFDVTLVHQHDLMYNVLSDDKNVGLCIIRSL